MTKKRSASHTVMPVRSDGAQKNVEFAHIEIPPGWHSQPGDLYPVTLQKAINGTQYKTISCLPSFLILAHYACRIHNKPIMVAELTS